MGTYYQSGAKTAKKTYNKDSSEKLFSFFRGQLILTLFLTLSTFIVFSLLQVPFALILSVIVGVIDIIPGIGAILAVVVTLIMLSQSVWLALKVLLPSW